MSSETGCPKCSGPMDEGRLSPTGSGTLPYTTGGDPKSILSNLSNPGTVFVQRARACLACGYLELYIDPQELVRKIAAL